MTIQNNAPPNNSPPQQPTSRLQRARGSPLAIGCVVALTLFTDMMVYGIVIPCLPKLVMDRLGGDSSMVGFLCGCYAFGLLVSTPIFAVLSDRYRNRRYPTMAGTIGLATSTVGFAMARTYPELVLARVAQGISGGASWAIGMGMLADVFPPERLGVVMGSVMPAHCLGFTIGPAIGGFLYEYVGYQAPFVFCGVFALINLFAVICIREPLVVAEELKQQRLRQQQQIDETSPLLDQSTSVAGEPKQDSITLLSLLRHKRILSCVIITVVSASVFAGIEPSLPIHLQTVYHCSPATIGLLFGAMVAPSFVSPAIGYLSDKFSRRVITSTGVLMMACVAPLVALNYSSLYMIIPSLMLFGLSGPVTLSPVTPQMGIIVHGMGGNAYAQVYALYNMAYGSGMFLGPVIAGFVMEKFGFTALMWLFSAILIVSSPVVIDWKGLMKKCFCCDRYS